MRIKKILFLFAFICQSVFIFSQNLNWQSFNKRRIDDSKKAMLILGGWAVGNMAFSALRVGNTSGTAKSFHQMNIGWNAVNLGIASLGYFSAARTDFSNFDAYKSIDEHYKFQKILLFNAGLDVGYMAAGAWLIERGKNATVKNPERMTGFGQALVLNGAFLFAFDLVNYFIQAGQNDKIRLLLNSTMSGTELGFRFIF